nr:hypothetical protein [Tanacetum cinerariifolium]
MCLTFLWPEPHPAYDFFTPGPLPGYAGNPDNNNEWIETDVPLLGELGAMADEPMVGSLVDEIVEPIVEMEDDDDSEGFKDKEEAREVNEEWLMALVTPPLMPVVPPISTYDVGSTSTTAAEGQSSPSQYLDFLCLRGEWYYYGEISPRVSAIEGHVQVMASQMVQALDRLEQQPMGVKKTSFPEMESSGSIVVNIPGIVKDYNKQAWYNVVRIGLGNAYSHVVIIFYRLHSKRAQLNLLRLHGIRAIDGLDETEPGYQRLIMGEPLSPDRVFDFPMDEPEPHLTYDFFTPGRYQDEPMVGPLVDEIAELIVKMEEQVIAPVIYMKEDITMLFGDGNFSDDDFEGFEDGEETACKEGDPGVTLRWQMTVDRLDQVGAQIEQGQQTTTQRDELQTMVSEMSSRESTLMRCIIGMDRCLADLKRRPPGPQ